MSEDNKQLAKTDAEKKELADKAKIEAKAKELLPKLEQRNVNDVYEFGAATQHHLTDVSRGITNSAKVNDVADINEDLVELERIFRDQGKPVPKHWWEKWQRKASDTLYDAKTRRQRVGATIDDIIGRLNGRRAKLVKDNNRMFEMYNAALKGAGELSPFIRAGEMEMKKMENDELPKLKKDAETRDPAKQNKYQSALFYYHAVSRRVNDLRLTQQANYDVAGKLNMVDISNQATISKISETTNLIAPIIQANTGAEMMMQQSKATNAVLQDTIDFANDTIKSTSGKIGELASYTYKNNEKGILKTSTLNSSADDIIKAIQSCRQAADEGERQRKETKKQIEGIAKKLQSVLDEAGNQIDQQNGKY